MENVGSREVREESEGRSMKQAWLVVAMVALASGCTGKVEKKLEAMAKEQQALDTRLAALEQAQREQREQLLEANAVGTQETARATAEPMGVATGRSVLVSSELTEALTDRINSLVLETVEATVDARIASRVGTPDDIEAIFSQVLHDEMTAKEKEERRENAERRRRQTAEWDVRSVERRVSAAGLDDEEKQTVLSAREAMRARLREQLPELEARNATVEEMLAVVAESRELYEDMLVETMTDEELQAFYEADRWGRRQQRRVDELTTNVGLDDDQKTLVDEAYTEMRVAIGDGYVLMSEGYLDRRAAHQSTHLLRETFTDNVRQILTPEQFQTYESSSGSGRDRWRGF